MLHDGAILNAAKMERAHHVFLSVLCMRRPEDGCWIAQALEHDFNARGTDADDAMYCLVRLIAARAHVLEQVGLKGKSPLDGVPEAPPEYWSLWHRAKRRNVVSEPMAKDAGEVPAYIVQAITDEFFSSNCH